MKRLVYSLLPLIISVTAVISCDIGGFQDLAEMIDPNSAIGTNSYSYLRASTDLDGNDVTTAITYSAPDGGGNGEFVLTVVVDDETVVDAFKTQVYMVRTTYNLAGGIITHTPYFAYRNTYKSGLGNATQSDEPDEFDTIVPETYLNLLSGPIPFDDTSIPGTLSYGGNDYTSFATLHDNVMNESTAEERAKQFMHMYEFTIITSQTKIEGFGGMGMIQYLGRTVSFNGIRTGTFELTSEGTLSNTSDFNYKSYSDYQGLTMQGLQRSSTGTSGDGNMSGTVTFTLQGSSQTWTGSVNYDTIVIEDTLPVSGNYIIKFDGIDDVGTGVDPLQTTNPGSFDYSDLFS
jgi:hypothetical protein